MIKQGLSELIGGQEAINRSGLVPEHVAKFREIAIRHKMYLLFRPVNPLSTSLIQEGAATKGLNVHGKSADWGPQAGYIPFDADVSKVHGNLSKVLKGNADNHLSLEEVDANGNRVIGKTPLRLHSSRLEELQRKGIIQIKECDEWLCYIDSNNNIYDFQWEKDTGIVQYRTKEGKETVLGERFDWKPVEVMGKIRGEEVNPLTADYDVFAMAPSLSEIKKKIPAEEWKELVEDVTNPIEKWRNITRLLIKYGLTRESDPEKGKLAEWQRDIIEILNEAARQAGYTGGTVVNHGTEQDNNDYPEQDVNIFIITPEGEVFLTENWDETMWFVESVIVGNMDDTFLFYANRSYNVIAAGSYAQILWNEPIPTPLEFKAERVKLESVIEQQLPEEYIRDVQDLSDLFHLFYYPANQFIYFKRTNPEVSLFRAVQALRRVDTIIQSEVPIKEYQIYFEILYLRIVNHIKVILRIEGITLTITKLLQVVHEGCDEIVSFYRYLEAVHYIDAYPYWDSSISYGYGQIVQYNNTLYSAREWTKGNEPGKTRFWRVNKNYMIPWNAQVIFEYENNCLYKNRIYQAKEWTQGNEPDVESSLKWKVLFDRQWK
ncbi:hypothetical protein BTW32_31275 [Bacillus thuringiensis]|nr:hypothetical protein BTW32_31275 [Bacillus thuringiensis]